MKDKDRCQLQWWYLNTTKKTDRNKMLHFAKQNNKKQKNKKLIPNPKQLTHTTER